MHEIIAELAERYFSDTVSIRRHLHQYPELSFQEEKTARFIASQLELLGIDYQKDFAGHGVVALVKGNKPGERVTALRADMDALPIEEANEVEYKSLNPGVMHACGHDVHTASLLSTVRILHELRDHFGGTVKCIFQPAEEKLPGGASLMIAAGVLENPKPASIFGQHVHNPLPAGKVGFKPGMFMASSDEIYITIKGRGGHGAMPHTTIDPITMSAQLLVTLQQIVSRFADPTMPSVLTFGKIQSDGGATNVIPGEVKIEGTFRTFDEDWRSDAHKRMKKIAESLIKSLGGACEFNIVRGYPALINNEVITGRFKKWAEIYLGKENVEELPIRMTSEDFAYFSQAMPACFYRLGTGDPDKPAPSNAHTDTFNINEKALETGPGLMAWLAINELAVD